MNFEDNKLYGPFLYKYIKVGDKRIHLFGETHVNLTSSFEINRVELLRYIYADIELSEETKENILKISNLTFFHDLLEFNIKIATTKNEVIDFYIEKGISETNQKNQKYTDKIYTYANILTRKYLPALRDIITLYDENTNIHVHNFDITEGEFDSYTGTTGVLMFACLDKLEDINDKKNDKMTESKLVEWMKYILFETPVEDTEDMPEIIKKLADDGDFKIDTEAEKMSREILVNKYKIFVSYMNKNLSKTEDDVFNKLSNGFYSYLNKIREGLTYYQLVAILFRHVTDLYLFMNMFSNDNNNIILYAGLNHVDVLDDLIKSFFDSSDIQDIFELRQAKQPLDLNEPLRNLFSKYLFDDDGGEDGGEDGGMKEETSADGGEGLKEENSQKGGFLNIIHPVEHKRYSIFSENGKNLLKKYIKHSMKQV